MWPKWLLRVVIYDYLRMWFAPALWPMSCREVIMSSRKPSLQPSTMSHQDIRVSHGDIRANDELLELTARLKASYLKRENGLIESRNARRGSQCPSDVIVQVDEVESQRGVTNPLLTPVSVRSGTPSVPVQTSYSTLPIQRRGSPDSQAISSAATSSNGHHIRVKPALRPICTSIRICGLQWRSAGSKGFDGHTVHGIIVSGVVTIAFALFFIMYRKDDRVGPELAKKVATHVWQLQALLNIPSFQYTFMSYFHRFVKRWDSYKRKYTGAPLHMMTSFTYRTTAIVDSIFGVIVSLFIIGFTIGRVEFVTYQIRSFYPNDSHDVPPYIYFLFFFFNGGLIFIWMQPLLFLFVLSVLLRREFMELSKNFKAALALGMESRSKRLDVEGYRLRHIALCKLTMKLDDMVSPYICINYILGMPLLCGLIYSFLTAGKLSKQWPENTQQTRIQTPVVVRLTTKTCVNTPWLWQNRRHFADIFNIHFQMECVVFWNSYFNFQTALLPLMYIYNINFLTALESVWQGRNISYSLTWKCMAAMRSHICFVLDLANNFNDIIIQKHHVTRYTYRKGVRITVRLMGSTSVPHLYSYGVRFKL